VNEMIDETNKRYSRLLVVDHVGFGRDRRAIFDCVCDCGKITTVCGRDLRTQHTQSCGCLVKTHGHASSGKDSPTYVVWHGLLRGAKENIDPRWREFKTFLSDMGERPVGSKLKRKDRSKGFSQSNCYWQQ
jgi:hypothetical protein